MTAALMRASPSKRNNRPPNAAMLINRTGVSPSLQTGPDQSIIMANIFSCAVMVGDGAFWKAAASATRKEIKLYNSYK